MNRKAGFTLIELMIVVALFGILAAIAMVSFSKNTARNAVDAWTAVNRDAIATASRRAIAKRAPFMVVFTPTTVQWCEVPPIGQGTAPAYADAWTACPATETVGYEYGRVIDAGPHGGRSAQWYQGTDVVAADGTYVAPPRNTLSTVALYAGKNGVVSTSMKDAITAGGLPDPANATGFTLYTQSRTNDQAQVYNKRLIVYGLTGKMRIFEDH